MNRDSHILLGVAGSPVFHSKSPLIFRSIFSEKGIDASYIRIAVERADEAAALCRGLGFTGINVTAPFKNSIIPSLDTVSEEAGIMKSVNTVVNSNGRLTGYSTDYFGVISPLEKRIGSLSKKKAVIAGAGGAGVSAAFGLTCAGSDVTVLNITIDEAKSCAERFGCGYDLLANYKKHLHGADIFVSTLPHEAEMLDVSSMKKGSLVMDASYRKSHYRDEAGKYGLEFIPGEEWLVFQAIHACGHFLGFMPRGETAFTGVNEARNLKGIISLVGFMGSGKTSVGRELAAKRGMDFADIDELIVTKTGKPVNEIFSEMGEQKFREIESDILHSFKDRKNLVISCGGGAVLSERNRQFLKKYTECIWLYCGMETMKRRVNDGTRPLINAMKDLSGAEDLFSARKRYYAQSCESIVLTENTPEKTAGLINEEIRLSF